ncbi:class I SAM-dependent methyltransferase [bacterium]|nr:class I SAM-dependent methyltransferase [bacterium]
MKSFLEKPDLLFIIIVHIVIISISLMLWEVIGNKTVIFLIGMMSSVIVFTIIETYRRSLYFHKTDYSWLKVKQVEDYKQMEAFLSLLATIKIKHPLPPMRSWAVSPDFVNIVASYILDRKPKVILECGSGVSTLIISYFLKNLGQGHVWSLDHDKMYAEKTKQNLVLHGLNNIATVIHAPLKEISIHDRKWNWYNTEDLHEICNIDLLVIDGPVTDRYPALPVLFDSLSSSAVIILDDTTVDKTIEPYVESWLRIYDQFSCEKVNTEKGTIILKRANALFENIKDVLSHRV